MTRPRSQPALLAITHGGVAAPASFADGCRVAARAALAVLRRRGTALEAAVEATRILENDERFNAGFGSRLRLDGRTIEMDAAVMTSGGRFAAVAAVPDVPNPVLLAVRLLDTPVRLLVGDGARRFAERVGLAGPVPIAPRARTRFREIARLIASNRLREEYAPWDGVDLARIWNFEGEMPDYAAIPGDDPVAPPHPAAGPEPGGRPLDASSGPTDACDTVGAVARDHRGDLACASSTGGTAVMLHGRVGDTPLIGCGLYAGPHGAVTVTGEGEEIIARMLSRWIYDRIADGATPTEACRAGVALFPPEVVAGAIAVTPDGHGHAANRPMPVAVARDVRTATGTARRPR